MTGIIVSSVIGVFALVGMKVTWDRFQEPIINFVLSMLRILTYPIVWLTNGKSQAERIRKEHTKWLAD
ncbi:hypothetical protein [Weissella minor]|uniref:hypothetical protein n=1 Tax=Weissella minor TaxID=1620 RepID=UPI0007093889|nr:hypothetical protein [Weissella minor]